MVNSVFVQTTKKGPMCTNCGSEMKASIYTEEGINHPIWHCTDCGDWGSR
jgi:uncharacterized Zn finger protein